jgi:hypothetical protein
VYRLLEIMDENEAECVKPFRAFSRSPLKGGSLFTLW